LQKGTISEQLRRAAAICLESESNEKDEGYIPPLLSLLENMRGFYEKNVSKDEERSVEEKMLLCFQQAQKAILLDNITILKETKQEENKKDE